MQPQLHFLLTSPSLGIANSIISLCVLLIWAGLIMMLILGSRHYPKLSSVKFTNSDMTSLPKLSIIVAACNEATTVEQGMRSLLQINYSSLEIIAVNDRSTDTTGEILEKLASEDSRLKVIHINKLPDGWLGKNHALQTAAEIATGEWILFTDADVIFAPSALRKAVAFAVKRKFDHLVVTPSCDTRSFWEKLFVSYFGLMFCFRVRLWDIQKPSKPDSYVGIGAFNLVRSEAYRKFGGHRALPMEVADDVKLGKVIKQNGFRTCLLNGGDLLSVRWVSGLDGVVNSLSKNAFAGFEYRLLAEIGGILTLAITSLYPVVALLSPNIHARVEALSTLLCMMLGAGLVKTLSGAGARYGVAYPLACLLLIYIIIRSTVIAYRQDGIIWRGTRYPLDELRRGVV